jgi:hypothetical protein
MTTPDSSPRDRTGSARQQVLIRLLSAVLTPPTTGAGELSDFVERVIKYIIEQHTCFDWQNGIPLMQGILDNRSWVGGFYGRD